MRVGSPALLAVTGVAAAPPDWVGCKGHPVASNDAGDGHAKNRRVALVEQ